MPKINTAAEARIEILEAIKVCSREEILDTIAQWNNTTDNDIDEDGNVWVANPQTGHWLDDDRLIEFARFMQ
jgi:hypothetical protein